MVKAILFNFSLNIFMLTYLYSLASSLIIFVNLIDALSTLIQTSCL
jgi:hypothetical protein